MKKTNTITLAEAALAHGGVPYEEGVRTDWSGAKKELYRDYSLLLCGSPKRPFILHEDQDNHTHDIITIEALRRQYACCYWFEKNGQNGKVRKVHLVDWWLEQQDRRCYTDYVFRPDRFAATNPTFYNIFQGLNPNMIVEPGDTDMWCEHIHRVICDGDGDSYNYFMRWCSNAITNFDLENKCPVAIAMRGEQGTGKGLAVDPLGRIVSPHYVHVTHTDHVVGKFNRHLATCILLFGDEAFFAGDKQSQSTLKGLVSEKEFILEMKNVDAKPSPNFINLILASNSDWVIPAGHDERRWFVLDVSSRRKGDTKYFTELAKHTRKHYGHICYMLQKNMHDDVDLRKAPLTKGLRRQKVESMSLPLQFWFHILNEGRLPKVQDTELPYYVVSCRDLQASFDAFTHRSAGRGHIKGQDLGYMLERYCKVRERKKKTVGKGRQEWCYIFPDLWKCRKVFDEAFNMQFEAGFEWDTCRDWRE